MFEFIIKKWRISYCKLDIAQFFLLVSFFSTDLSLHKNNETASPNDASAKND